MATVSYISSSKLASLLETANKQGGLFVRVENGRRLALGTDPTNPTLSIDLSREILVPYTPTEKPAASQAEIEVAAASPPTSNAERSFRRSGDYSFELLGQRYEFGSLRELLAQGLRLLEELQPGTLEKLSRIKPKSKRIVARDKRLLFEAQHLSEKYGERLMNEWWYGTNNSSEETSSWLERACECAGLEWGRDLRIDLGN